MRLGRVLPWLAVLAASLAGCGGNPEPAPLPSPSTSAASPSPSESGSPSEEPSLPAEAQGTTKKSARAFVRLYVRRVNEAGQTGDVAALEAMADPKCGNCSAVVAAIREVYAEGGSIEGATWRLLSISRAKAGPGGKVALVVRTRAITQVVTPSAGAKPKKYQGGAEDLRLFTLTRAGRQWKILTYYTEKLG